MLLSGCRRCSIRHFMPGHVGPRLSSYSSWLLSHKSMADLLHPPYHSKQQRRLKLQPEPFVNTLARWNAPQHISVGSTLRNPERITGENWSKNSSSARSPSAKFCSSSFTLCGAFGVAAWLQGNKTNILSRMSLSSTFFFSRPCATIKDASWTVHGTAGFSTCCTSATTHCVLQHLRSRLSSACAVHARPSCRRAQPLRPNASKLCSAPVRGLNTGHGLKPWWTRHRLRPSAAESASSSCRSI